MMEVLQVRAAIYSNFGPPEVMSIKDIEKPSIKEQDRVLVRVHSASVNTMDYLYRKGYLLTRFDNGLTKPKNPVLGIDVAGTIEAVGENVRKFKVGDHVFGSCFGSHSEYVSPRVSIAKRNSHSCGVLSHYLRIMWPMNAY
ncbi:alcohol dehydrogenase catalytic domain-containing protein [Bacillus infantis]|uniref:alcohol dehydrogenase catalytic domain-containing protein n=1 Tax=Bacillus infantis TaxID=324767 RepID=UPI003CF5EC24